MALRENEAGFQDFVISYAKLRGWLVFHTHDSRHSEAGFPDLLMLRGTKLIVAELKTETGKVTAEQRTWLDGFERAFVPSWVWRPSERDEVMAVLG